MEMVCDLCELGTESMYTYTDKFNEFYPLKVYEINCVINIHTHPLKSSPAPTTNINPLNPELNPICYLLALLGARHFLHVSRIRVKLLTFRLLMSYIYEAPILDVSRSHTTTQHSR